MNKFKPNRVRKHRHRARQHDGTAAAAAVADSNASELAPRPETKEMKARKDALEELQEKGMSSKKKKRLEKYVDNKLRKEQNLDLLKKLAAHKVDTSLYQSTKEIGQQKESKRSAMSRALDRERAGISSLEDKKLLYEPQRKQQDKDDDSGSEDDSSKSLARAEQPPAATVRKPDVTTMQAENAVSLGAGLKRPLQVDAKGAPVIKKRQRTNKRVIAQVESQPEIPWEGFSSEDGSEDAKSGSNSEGESGEANSEDNESSDSASRTDTETDSEELSDISESDYAAIFAIPSRKKASEEAKEAQTQRRADFKAWATQQMNEARDFAPTEQLSHIEALSQVAKPASFTPRAPETDPLPRELQISTSGAQRHSHSVLVERPETIQDGRLKLPIVAEEQKIMEAIHNNPVVVVCGATGSGKTTQIPQFLYEAGYGSPDGPAPGMIAVTQPRRVAAVTMAKRVGEELGKDSPNVGYQIRFDSSVGSHTRIKFMTDGVLLREIGQDFILKKYSVIVIDEAHERSVNTDILIGMASRIVALRNRLSQEDPEVKPLKLIIMSATLMVDIFTKNTHLFRDGEPPLVESEGRQFPITTHFARRTQRDYMEEMFKKVTRGHKKLPPGAMLVFLTGQSEINTLANRLRQALTTDQPAYSTRKVNFLAKDASLETEDVEIGDDRLANDYESESEDSMKSNDEEDDKEFDIYDDQEPGSAKVSVLPLYSQLPIDEQTKVFQPPPPNTRLIILSTNVAETSITIPGVRYVFDCGRAKMKVYDKTTGVQSFKIGWISKDSSAQRAGRAGRTGPGHCYRLYSSAVFERDFDQHASPEILNEPVEGVVLQLKAMDLQHVVNFPFPTAPDRQDIARAETLLSNLGAIDKEGKITKSGRKLSVFPVSPRFAKMLSIGNQQDCMYLTIALVAALATPELYIPEHQLDLHRHVISENTVYTHEDHIADEARDARRKAYNSAHHKLSAQDPSSDAIKLLTTFCGYASQTSNADRAEYCSENFLRPKAMSEALQLYKQLLRIVALNNPGHYDPLLTHIPSPSKTQLAALKQIVALGFLDQIAIRADLAPTPPEDIRKPSRVRDVPYLTLFPSHDGHVGAKTPEREQSVYIHPSSVLSHKTPSSLPAFLVYNRLQLSSNTSAKTPKTWMHPLAPISPQKLAGLGKGTPLVEYGKPIGKVEAGKESGTRTAWVVPSFTGRNGSAGAREWPLPMAPMKVFQRRNGRGGWDVEKVLG